MLDPSRLWLNIMYVGLQKGFALDGPVVEALEVFTALQGTDRVLGARRGCSWQGTHRRGGAEMGSSGGVQRWSAEMGAVMGGGDGVQRWGAEMAAVMGGGDG